MAFTPGLTITDCGPKRGRGVVATSLYEVGQELYTAHPNIAVIYTDHVKSVCAGCFRPLAALKSRKVTLDVCPTCEHYALCRECSSVTKEEETTFVETNSRWKGHRQECTWFMTLSTAVRQGETDYVRFLLHYASRAQNADMTLLQAITECCSNEEAQSPQTKQFAAKYAAITVNQFAPYGMVLSEEALRQVLLRVKSNALGFPFSAEETLGWAMEGNICAVNHACNPNAALRQDEQGRMSLIAIQHIDVGDEVTISYIHVPDFPGVRERRRALLEQYRFLCTCSKCVGSDGDTASSSTRSGRSTPPSGGKP